MNFFMLVSVLTLLFGYIFSDNFTINDSILFPSGKLSCDTIDASEYQCDRNYNDEKTYFNKYSKNIGWITRPLMEALWGFSPEPFSNNTTTLCSKHSQLYRDHLEKNYLWATQMLDASTLTPAGILSGNNYQLGHFDQCLNIDVDIGNNLGRIRGQYCLAKIIINPSQNALPNYYSNRYVKHPYELHYDPMLSTWTKMKLTVDPSKKQRNRIYWSVCVPSACSTKEIEDGLKEKIIPALAKNGIDATVTLDEKFCHVKSLEKLTTRGKNLFMLFCFLSLTLVVISSIFDIAFYRNTDWDSTKNNEKKGKMESFMLSFSVYQNLLNLSKPDPVDDLNVMHGMRTYTTVLVLLGHRIMYSYGSPFHNPESLEQQYRNFGVIFILNGFLIVDTFFVLSGFLTCYMLLINPQRSGNFNFKLIYFHRFLRILPLYIIILATYINILPIVGDGPMWSIKAGVEAERCRKNWWTNVLFINNYVDAEMCMFQSWFLTCDVHFFIFGTLLVYLLYKRPKLGVTMTLVCLLISIIIPYLVIYVKNLDGVLKVYMSTVEDPVTNDYVKNIYIKSHNRAGPYIVGILAAYLYYVLKNRKFKFSLFQIHLGSVIFIILGFASLLLAWIFYIPGREYSVIENALYSSLHRIVWSCAMSWIIIAGGTTSFGIVNPILCMKCLVPMSRLTYGVFLIHGLVQLYSVATIRVPEYITFPKMFWMWSADVAFSFIFALIVHLIFEAPLNGLSKILVSSILQSRKTEKAINDEKSDEKCVKQKSVSNNHIILPKKMNRNRNNKKYSKSKMNMSVLTESVLPQIEKKHL